MLKYIIKRILWMIPVFLGVVFLIFTLNYISPSDPVVAQLGTNYTQEQYDQMEHQMGLDQPFLVQYGTYIKNIVTKFDFGESYSTHRQVGEMIAERFPTTLMLGIFSMLLTIILAVPLGVLAGTRQYSPLDYCVVIGTVIFAALPSFWIALMAIILFSFKLNWLPATGLDSWKSWILPVACLGLTPVASIMRMTRSSILEVIRQDYITTARAKGLPEGQVIRRHAIKNSLIPVITAIGMQVGMVMGGSILVETIFSFPGIGTLLNTAIAGKDYPVIEGCVVVLSISISVINLIVDLAYAYIDPRIHAQYVSSSGKKKQKAAQESA
jgi:peptide/nickel transport system permease protein